MPLKSPSPGNLCHVHLSCCLLAVFYFLFLIFFLVLQFLFAFRDRWIQTRWDFRERIKNVRLWKANSIRKRRSRFTAVIKNRFHIKCSSGTSAPPRSNDNCAANKNTESPTTRYALWRGLFQYTESQLYCPSSWWREASWFPPVGEHAVLPSAIKKKPRCISSNWCGCQ